MMPDKCPKCGEEECYVFFKTCEGKVCDNCYVKNRKYYEDLKKKIRRK